MFTLVTEISGLGVNITVNSTYTPTFSCLSVGVGLHYGVNTLSKQVGGRTDQPTDYIDYNIAGVYSGNIVV